ncbi:MAG: hypothetical protein S4CHLAM102_00940 [Chlamydiia bacterium]|nr:hypothetical protein [Chlamydiia bacterium]
MADDHKNASIDNNQPRKRGRPRKHPVVPEGEKRKRGRPRKEVVEGAEVKVKRPRGRPRKEGSVAKPTSFIKRGRGRPKQTTILTKEPMGPGIVDEKGQPMLKSTFQRVDGNYLVKHLMTYLTKVVMIHGELSKMDGVHRELFERLKVLDIQMIDVCTHLMGMTEAKKAA